MGELDEYGFVVNVEGAIVDDDRYLLIERGTDEDHAAGLLGFPGGKTERRGERNDPLEDALKREIEEEVGLHPGEIRYVQSNAFTADGTPCINVVFACRHGGETPERREPGEVSALHWLTPEEASARENCPPWTARFLRLVAEHRAEFGW